MHLVHVDRDTTSHGALSVYAIGDTHLDLKTSDHDCLAAYIAHIAKGWKWPINQVDAAFNRPRPIFSWPFCPFCFGSLHAPAPAEEQADGN